MFETLSEKFEDAFKHLRGKGKLSESNIEQAIAEVKTALLEADVNFKVVKSFIAGVRDKSLGEKVVRGVDPQQQFIKVVQDELATVMGAGEQGSSPLLDIDGAGDRTHPLPVLVVGLNGAGKTTLTGKLAHWLVEQKKQDILVVPADTFRPAAKEQLRTLCERAGGVECFDSDLTLHPQEIVRMAMAQAKREGRQVVLIDTAGRLHVDEELMGQIAQVKKQLASFVPEVFLVADAMTGQEAVNVARSFHEAVGLTGIVLSKMDSDARGGAALSIRSVTGVPIRFISSGEKLQDLELFHPDRLASRILDMGDVVSLVEKAEQVMDEKEAERMMANLEKNRFTMNDFMVQMEKIAKMGPMADLLKMMPGMGGVLRKVGDLSSAEGEIVQMKVMMNSMTPGERDDYKILNDSRIQRIARGSGNHVQEVKGFIAKFRQMERMMGGMMKMMKEGGGLPFPGMGGVPAMGGGGGPGKGKRPKGRSKGKGKFGGGYFW